MTILVMILVKITFNNRKAKSQTNLVVNNKQQIMFDKVDFKR